ncbi:MAG TPA: iron-containing alcohol dehydrogenase [Spirochaetota bacterium]|nr:iron-containing alcohol dehydrogenase [Spirochaetota bacterium]
MHIPEYFEFFNKSKISSGKKALENIPFDLRSMNATKPLVVTDALSVKQGFVKVLKTSFNDSGMVIGAVYDGVNSYPSTSEVRELASLYRDRGCDSIIALGGSAPASVAKGLNILVSNKSNNLMEYADMSKSAELRPFILVPTSDASGTEASNEAMLDARIYRSHDLMPDIIVIDPRMMGKNDVHQTVNAGLLGIVQAIESCNISVSNVINDSFAFASISLIGEKINSTAACKCKKKERAALINGVTISGIVYSNAPEGLARAIGFEAEKMTGNPAGICAGIVLAYLLDYKLSSIKSGVRGELFLPLAGIDKYCSIPEEDRPEAGVDALFKLLDNLDRQIPRNLKEMNIPEYMINKIAAAAEERTGTLFPKGTALKVLQNAYHGKKSAEVR